MSSDWGKLKLHFREKKSSKQKVKALKTNQTLLGDHFENKDEGWPTKTMLEVTVYKKYLLFSMQITPITGFILSGLKF